METLVNYINDFGTMALISYSLFCLTHFEYLPVQVSSFGQYMFSIQIQALSNLQSQRKINTTGASKVSSYLLPALGEVTRTPRC